MKKQPQKKFYKKKKVEEPPKKVVAKAKESSKEKVIYVNKKKPNLSRLIYPPAILLSILFLSLALYFFLQLFLRELIFQAKQITYTPITYPVFSPPVQPEISAEAAIIMENESKAILFQKNPQFRFSMASTTKVMTAIVGLSQFGLNDVLTVKRNKVEGAAAGFYAGEKLRFEDVLYGLLLPSGNDAAYTVADNYPGGVEQFVVKMNEKAQELGLYNTHYSDPAGLNDDEDYTTVRDLAKLTSSAIRNPVIAKVTSTKEKIISDTSGKKFVFNNLNKLLGLYGVTGLKTGTTEGAGEVLITTSVMQGKTFIIVVMKSTDRFSDTQILLNSLSANTTFISPRYPFVPSTL